jgi:hypothetical protein
MGLFDYLFDPRSMGYQGDLSGGYVGTPAPTGTGGLFDGLFASRWDPVQQAIGSGQFDPMGSNNTSAYTASAPVSQLPFDPMAGAGAPREGTPGYYGGAPSTNPLLAPRDPQNRLPAPPRRPLPTVPADWPPSQPPGFGDRIGAGLQGAGSSFMGGGGPIGALVNMIGGIASGKRTDPQGVANEEVLRMYRFLQSKEGGGLSPAQAQSVVMHPELAKEYYKGLVNAQPVMLPDGTVALPGSFGQPPRIVGSAAKPELKERYNPTTGRMELTAVTPPTIGNPRMAVTTPGGPVLPGQGTGARLPGQADVGVSFPTAPSIEEKKTQEGVAEANVADFKQIQTQALNASSQRSTFARMRQLNAMPTLGQGQLAPIQQTFRSAMVSLGLGDASKVKPGEEFQSLASNLVLEAVGGSLGNQISDGDRKYMAARIPSLENTKEGRDEMLTTLELLAQRKIDIAKEAVKYRGEHGRSLDGFQTYIADWAEKNPLFKDRPAMITSGEGPIRIPDTMTPAEVRKNYKPGTQIILPDGRIGVVPNG